MPSVPKDVSNVAGEVTEVARSGNIVWCTGDAVYAPTATVIDAGAGMHDGRIMQGVWAIMSGGRDVLDVVHGNEAGAWNWV